MKTASNKDELEKKYPLLKDWMCPLQNFFPEIAIAILALLSEKELYPKKIAQILGINEQKVYYYINNLKKGRTGRRCREEYFGGIKQRTTPALPTCICALEEGQSSCYVRRKKEYIFKLY